MTSCAKKFRNTILTALAVVAVSTAVGDDAKPGTLVTAQQFGSEPARGTEILQAAIDSGADIVHIPNLGEPWIVAPLTLRDNITLIFDPGTVLEAKKGAYKDRGANLLSARGKSNITILGNGAEIRMHREEYVQDDHPRGEWRHGIGLYGCKDVLIDNITVIGSGGDGLYIGSGAWTPPQVDPVPDMPAYGENITVRRFTAIDNRRQGISLITGKNIIIEDSELRNTHGTPPQAGIDIEPNSPRDVLKNIVVRNVDSIGNRGSAFEIHIGKLDGTSEPISIRIENCRALDGNGGAFSLHGPGGDTPVPGIIEVVDLYADNMGGPAINIREKPAESMLVRFVRCYFSNVSQRDEYYAKHPIWFQVRQTEYLVQGGVEFVDCVLEDTRNRPFLVVENQRMDQGEGIDITELKGNIEVRSPYKPGMRIEPVAHTIELNITYSDEELFVLGPHP